VRQLHLVGVTDDKAGLIVAETGGAGAATFVLPITDEVRAAIRPGGSRRGGQGGEGGEGSGSRLTPREIQSRLRTGRSIDQVADEAGVSPEWVDRFAGPIIAEQHVALTRAQTLRVDSPRRGPSLRPLSEAVTRNLLVKGVRLTEEEIRSGWSAHLYQTGEWMVSFRYPYRRREVTADWLVDLAAGTVVALDRSALSLGFIGPAEGTEAGSPPAPSASDPGTAPSTTAPVTNGRRSGTGTGTGTGNGTGNGAGTANGTGIGAVTPAPPGPRRRRDAAEPAPAPAGRSRTTSATTRSRSAGDTAGAAARTGASARAGAGKPSAAVTRAGAGTPAGAGPPAGVKPGRRQTEQPRLVRDRRPPGAGAGPPEAGAVEAGGVEEGRAASAAGRSRRRRKESEGEQPRLPGVE
jgi:Protein of unknown function (DUF3071)